tara:strand:+ start:71 stop:484 length:414 start_codon:yes stop_codon:yes gene_type:complete
MIHLCYKKYEWKASMEACKSFADKTGLDLKTVFGDYILACMNTPKEMGLFERSQIYAHLHTRKVAGLALHSIINAANNAVLIDEIDDATFRVDWLLSDRPDDLSEPWHFVMLNTALEMNEYFNNNIPKKKEAATSDD